MAAYTLALEGSTYAGSVALLRGGIVIAERTLTDSGVPSRDGRDERLLPSVAECLAEAEVSPRQIVNVVCGAGPGSFTSLRIAASLAKGIAVGTGSPLFSVSSLLLTVACAGLSPLPGSYLSVLPAMREEWFALLVDLDAEGSVASRGEVSILGRAELATVAAANDARLLGPGQDIEARPHARGVARFLDQIWSAGPVSVELWEPEYGRLAEAQVKWEVAHGRSLHAST